MRPADLLLGNDLFQTNSKLRDPIEIDNFDVSSSPVMDKMTSSEPIGNLISVTRSEQNIEQVEMATLGDQIVESEVKLVNSEIVMSSGDLIETAAVTRPQSKQEFDVDDGNTGSVTLSDETNQMHRDMDMTKFKEMEETCMRLDESKAE